MEITNDEANRLHGQDVVGVEGEKVGSVDDLYVDADSGQPEWVLVNRGLFGMAHSVVPLMGARRGGDGGLQVAFTKDAVTKAPDVDAGTDITVDDERRLYEHYGQNLPEVDGVLVIETYDMEAVRRPTELRRGRIARGNDG